MYPISTIGISPPASYSSGPYFLHVAYSIGKSSGTLLINVVLRKSIMRLFKVAALVLIVGAAGLVSVSLARAASDCPTSVTLSDWGENSTGYFSVASGGSCLFPIKMAGEVSSSEISQKPAHGKLKRLNISTYEYTAKARYKGSDTFAIKATGKGPTASGTSVITVHATIQ
jgi:hypothetical protein